MSLRKTLRFVSVAAALMLLCAISGKVVAGIRLTVWETGGSQHVWYADGNEVHTATINTGSYTVHFDDASSNFNGLTDGFGKLSQTIDITHVDANVAGKTLYAYAEVVTDANLMNSNASVDKTGDATIAGLGLDLFVAPNTSPVFVTASAGGSAAGISGGLVSVDTFVNAGNSYTGLLPFGSLGSTYQASVLSPTGNYTLAQLVTLSVTSATIASTVDLVGTSDVFGSPLNDALPSVPEPASLAIWGLGAFGLAAFRVRRRDASK